MLKISVIDESLDGGAWPVKRLSDASFVQDLVCH